MSNSNLTIRDVLPTSMRSNYSDELLNTLMQTAVDVVKYDMPAPSDLTDKDIEDLNAIYAEYQGTHNGTTDSGYWNASSTDNEAYWSGKS